MIPVRDNIPSQRFPVFNTTIILANMAVYAHEFFLTPEEFERLLSNWAFIPAQFSIVTLFSSMFMHGSILHVLGNMAFLYALGANVESRMGHVKYLVFYMFTGVLATLAQYTANVDSTIPMVGASGAISGIMGAYFFLFPKARVLMAGFLIVYPLVYWVPTIWMLTYWFGMQLFFAALSIFLPETGGGIAFWAHVGGFVSGLVICAAFRSTLRARRGY